MLRKLSITFFVLILLLGGVMGYLQYMKIKKPISPAIDAIPTDAFIIIQSVNSQAVWQTLNQSNALWTDLKKIGVCATLNSNLVKLDSIATEDSRLSNLLQKSPLFVSYHKVDSNNVEALISCNVPNSIEENEIKQLIENTVDKSTVFSEYLYQNAIVHEIKYRGTNGKTLCYAKLKGTFIVSYSPELVKRSITHINTNKSLAQDASFNKVYNSVGNGVDASVFINFGNINTFMPMLFNGSTLKDFGQLSTLACWTVLDTKFTGNSVQFNGFTYAKDSLNNYLCVFKNLKPQPLQGALIMPTNVSTYLSITFDNYSSFNTNYKKYLQRNGTLKYYTESIDKLKEKHGVDVEKIMNNVFIQEIDLFKLDDLDSANSELINIHCTDGAIAYTQFKDLFSTTVTQLNNDEPEIDAENDSLQHIQDSTQRLKPKAGIYKVKTSNLFSTLLGGFYANTSSNYVLYYKNDFVFAKSKAALEQVYQAIADNTTLAQNEGYLKFAQSTAAKANINWYMNGSKATNFIAQKINLNAALELNRYTEVLDKTEGFIMQLTSTGSEMLLTNIYARYNALSKTPDNTLWKVKLDSAILSQPFIVTNHTNNTHEVIVQDAAYNLYLISCTGEILWKHKIKGAIQGKITQVDKFKNKKLQYVFSTSSHIYMLDRNGKDIENFPIQLAAKASNAVSVFDYDKQRDYRLVIACDNNRIYNYDTDGGAIGGWNNTTWNSPIHCNIGWFAVKGKDYITVVQDNGTATFVDRKGATIEAYDKAFVVGTKHQLCYSIKDKKENSCVITTDNEGTVQKLFVDGHKETLSINKLSPEHYIDVIDFNEDGEDDYMITEMNYVAAFDNTKKMLFNHKFKSAITQQPTIHKTNANHYKVGVVTALSSEIFLINNDGSIAEGFPKNGTTNFTMADANKDEINDIIVGTSPNYVTAYSLTEAGKLYKPKEIKTKPTVQEEEAKEPIVKNKKEEPKKQKTNTSTDKKQTTDKNKNKENGKSKEKTKTNDKKTTDKDTKKTAADKKKTTDTKKETDKKTKAKEDVKTKPKPKDKPKEKTKPKPEEKKDTNDDDDDKIINDSSEG
jgi:hypothetical protein